MTSRVSDLFSLIPATGHLDFISLSGCSGALLAIDAIQLSAAASNFRRQLARLTLLLAIST